MKIIVVLFSISLFSLTKAQNCSLAADYSNITAITNSLAASLSVTNGLINLIPNIYLYSGYSEYWSDYYNNLNIYGNSFAFMAGNITTNLLMVFRNLSLSVSNTSANSNLSIYDLQSLIGQTYIYMSGVSAADSNYVTQLGNDLNMQLMKLNSFIYNLLSNVGQLGYTGLPPTSSNIFKALPSPLVIQGLIQSLQNVTNVYIKYLNSSAINITNLYNVFKSSDPTLRAWDLMKNQTAYNWTLATNNTQIIFNGTITNFTKQANSIYNNFISQVPAQLKNNANFQADLDAGQSFLANFNTSIQTFQDQLAPYFDTIRMQIEQYELSFLQNVFSMIRIYRQQIFNAYQINMTTLNCSIAMLNASEALWKTYGGPNNFFNCSTYENGLLPKLQAFLQSFMATFAQDVNATLADFQRCLFVKNLTNDNAAGAVGSYSMQQCIESNGASFSTMTTTFYQFSSPFLQILSGMLSNANTRAYACFKDTTYGLYGTFYPVLDAFSACVSKSMPTTTY